MKYFELLERLLDLPGSSLGRVDGFEDVLWVLWRRPGDAPGAPEDVLGRFSAPSWEAQGVPRRSFWSCFESKSWFISRNGEMLENEELLNENAILWTS